MDRAWRTIIETGRGTRCLGGFLAALVFLLVATVASPSVHKALHADSDHADHSCAVTLFAQGIEPGTNETGPLLLQGDPVVEARSAHAIIAIAEPAHLRPPASGPPSD